MENINVSIGELWDKYTILLIKKYKINDTNKLSYINNEILLLYENMKKYDFENNHLFKQLKNINEDLWDIEDKLRIKEKNLSFDNDFIELARSVYYTNDKRASIKNKINTIFNSNIFEVKDYVNYK